MANSASKEGMETDHGLTSKIRLLDTALASEGAQIRGDNELQAVALAAGYLGLVLRCARQWFIFNEEEAYGRFQLRWQLNLGIPSAGYEDKHLRKLFAIAAEVAWTLSTLEGRAYSRCCGRGR